jgi:hypothetical protein
MNGTSRGEGGWKHCRGRGRGRWFVSRCNFKLADWPRVWMDPSEGVGVGVIGSGGRGDWSAKPPFYRSPKPRGGLDPSIDPSRVCSLDREPFDRSERRTLKWRVYKIFLSIYFSFYFSLSLVALLRRLCFRVGGNGTAFSQLNRHLKGPERTDEADFKYMPRVCSPQMLATSPFFSLFERWICFFIYYVIAIACPRYSVRFCFLVANLTWYRDVDDQTLLGSIILHLHRRVVNSRLEARSR